MFIGYVPFAREGMCIPPAPHGLQVSPVGQEGPTVNTPKREPSGELKPGAKSVDWKSMIPEIRTALKQALPDGVVERHYAIRITRVADITGDGVPEALVYTGDGGASTDFLVLMHLEDGKPVVARFKDEKGKLFDPGFLEGYSVTHGDSTVMLPDENTIYLGSHFINDTGTGFSRCGVRAYRWKAETKTLDWNRNLSKRLTRTFCESERKALIKR